MERKSSIHIEAGKVGEFFHNDRTKLTANSIFSIENNYYSLDAVSAIELYKKDLKEKTKIYTERTGRSLHKNTITLLSAIINLDKQHTKEDLQKVAEYLEQSLDTKIYQYSIHRDEGYINENGEEIINYHAHILFSGLDEEGRSVRKKLTRAYLINLQTEVAKILKMERGINYTKEQKKRPKRLNTYEYKEHAKRQAEALKPVLKENKKIEDLVIEKNLEIFDKKAKINNLKTKNEELKKELAKVKDLKIENKKLRDLLKSLRATREDYAYLEQFIKDLKNEVKNKNLTLTNLKQQMEQLKQEFKEKLNKKNKEIEQLKQENDALINNLYDIEQLEKETKQLQKKVYSPYKNKQGKVAWQQVADFFNKKSEQKEEENLKLKKEKEELEEKLLKKEKIIKKLDEELNKIISKFNLEKNDNLLLTIKIISNALNSLKKEELNNPKIMMENTSAQKNKPGKKLKEEADRIVNEIFDNNPEEDEEYIAPTRMIKR
jgi:chromosome segregation ATPase